MSKTQLGVKAFRVEVSQSVGFHVAFPWEPFPIQNRAEFPRLLRQLDKQDRKGRVLRYPVRSDIQTPIEEYLIVELYSK